MILFVKLLLAHLLGDFIWQPNSWVADKEIKKHKSIYLYAHIILHGVLAAILVGEIYFIPYAILIAITHGIVDLIKLNFQKKQNKTHMVCCRSNRTYFDFNCCCTSL